MKKTFRYIIKKDGDYYVCMCLDVCMVSQGKTKEEAQKDLEYLIKSDYLIAQEEGLEPNCEKVEPQGWFKETFGFTPGPYQPIHTITVDV